MALPSTTFVSTATVVGVKTYLTFTPPSPGTAVTVVAKMSDYDGTNTILRSKVPGADGVLRNRRAVRTEAEETFTLQFEELTQLIALLGAFNGFKTGTAQLWVVDPDDTTGNAAVKSEVFATDITRDGPLSFSAQNFTEVKVKLTSQADHDIVFTLDGAA